MRIQKTWRHFSRNRWLEERVTRVFAIARAGDVDGMTMELRMDPDVLFMRDRYITFRTSFFLDTRMKRFSALFECCIAFCIGCDKLELMESIYTSSYGLCKRLDGY